MSWEGRTSPSSIPPMRLFFKGCGQSRANMRYFQVLWAPSESRSRWLPQKWRTTPLRAGTAIISYSILDKIIVFAVPWDVRHSLVWVLTEARDVERPRIFGGAPSASLDAVLSSTASTSLRKTLNLENTFPLREMSLGRNYPMLLPSIRLHERYLFSEYI